MKINSLQDQIIRHLKNLIQEYYIQNNTYDNVLPWILKKDVSLKRRGQKIEEYVLEIVKEKKSSS